MEAIVEIKSYVENCLLPKLPKNYEEYNDITEHCKSHEKELDTNFRLLKDVLTKIDLRNHVGSSGSAIASLLILFHELGSDIYAQNEKRKKYALNLNDTFTNRYGISLDCINLYCVLQVNNIFKSQDIYDNIMHYLHKKLTPDDFKKYPGLIDVYWAVLNNLKEFNVALTPVTTLPISLLLIDDYVKPNKVKGLECCYSVLQCLRQEDFEDGNYYDVIFQTLKKIATDRDMDITRMTMKCFIPLLPILPCEKQFECLEDIFAIIIETLYTETSLYRKDMCFKFLKSSIPIMGVESGKKYLFMTVILDNLHLASHKAIGDILLQDVLLCLQVWIEYCWCLWEFNTDHKILSALFKLLYVCKNEYVPQIHKLIISLITLCTPEQQSSILENLKSPVEFGNEEFSQRLDIIKNYFVE